MAEYLWQYYQDYVLKNIHFQSEVKVPILTTTLAPRRQLISTSNVMAVNKVPNLHQQCHGC